MRRILLLLLLMASPAIAEQDRTVAIGAKKVTNVPEIVMGTLPTRKVTYCILEGGAAAQIVIFRAVGGTPEYKRVTVPAGLTVTDKIGQNVKMDGMEILTVDPAGDVSVFCTYKLVK